MAPPYTIKSVSAHPDDPAQFYAEITVVAGAPIVLQLPSFRLMGALSIHTSSGTPALKLEGTLDTVAQVGSAAGAGFHVLQSAITPPLFYDLGNQSFSAFKLTSTGGDVRVVFKAHKAVTQK